MAHEGPPSSGSSRAFCVDMRLGGHPKLSLMGGRTSVLGMLAASYFAWYDWSSRGSTPWERSSVTKRDVAQVSGCQVFPRPAQGATPHGVAVIIGLDSP